MADLSKIRTDPKIREEGVWIELQHPLEDVRVRLRSEDYEPYQRAITRIVEQQQGNLGRYGRRQQQRLGDPIKFEEERGRAIAQHLLVDWENLTDGDKPLEFSVETAERYLTDRNYYDFYLQITDALDQVTRAKSSWSDDRKKSSANASAST